MRLTDALFLLAESRERPTHVGGLLLFEPPEGAGRDYIGELYEALLANEDVQPTFRKRPATLLGRVPNLAWSYDRELDVGYHVRRSELPRPGGVSELLELTSRLHSGMLDRRRPLWEACMVEGLNDGRFGLYVKLHHALMDGVSAVRVIQQNMLSADPADTELRAWWSSHRRPEGSGGSMSSCAVRNRAKSFAALAHSTLKLARAALWEQQLTLPFLAPRTMFNVKIGEARRCAVQSWSLERVMAVKEAAGVTVNDVVLAMCSGALRYYLVEQHALPNTPLVASVPISLRSVSEVGGNKIGTVLCNLATNIDDPATRLETISVSMRRSKKVFSELDQLHVLALSMLTMLLPLAFPSANVLISNVPGPAEPMYWGGARLDSIYPLANVMNGEALSVILTNNAGNLDFGLVACRRSVPHLQRLLAHLETSLSDLERAIGV
nr:putative diacyglycerol O-acyltransferase tgs2 [Mycobacterium riyadhense]